MVYVDVDVFQSEQAIYFALYYKKKANKQINSSKCNFSIEPFSKRKFNNKK